MRSGERPQLSLPMHAGCSQLTFCSVIVISMANSQFIAFAFKVSQSQSISLELKSCECKMASFILSAEESRLILTGDCNGRRRKCNCSVWHSGRIFSYFSNYLIQNNVECQHLSVMDNAFVMVSTVFQISRSL